MVLLSLRACSPLVNDSPNKSPLEDKPWQGMRYRHNKFIWQASDSLTNVEQELFIDVWFGFNELTWLYIPEGLSVAV